MTAISDKIGFDPPDPEKCGQCIALVTRTVDNRCSSKYSKISEPRTFIYMTNTYMMIVYKDKDTILDA